MPALLSTRSVCVTCARESSMISYLVGSYCETGQTSMRSNRFEASRLPVKTPRRAQRPSGGSGVSIFGAEKNSSGILCLRPSCIALRKLRPQPGQEVDLHQDRGQGDVPVWRRETHWLSMAMAVMPKNSRRWANCGRRARYAARPGRPVCAAVAARSARSGRHGAGRCVIGAAAAG